MNNQTQTTQSTLENIATSISIKAKVGKADELANLLTSAGALVKATEPSTINWYALKVSDRDFVIFDTFTETAGREAHFSGKVATALKDKADILVEGGWDNGVVANISNSEVLSSNH